ncbi:MAG: hypothetical protein HXS54_06005 [Theionarchaea archaeon]|nr:hypothetical protein [Theionarchaea archaeon]DBA34814.1 TPA_asm: hypothetical protein vir521_00020 [Caudoviricetes sp. vir521]
MKVIYKEEKREFAKEFILSKKELRAVEAAGWIGEVKTLRVCFRHPETGYIVCKMLSVEEVEWR